MYWREKHEVLGGRFVPLVTSSSINLTWTGLGWTRTSPVRVGRIFTSAVAWPVSCCIHRQFGYLFCVSGGCHFASLSWPSYRYNSIRASFSTFLSRTFSMRLVPPDYGTSPTPPSFPPRDTGNRLHYLEGTYILCVLTECLAFNEGILYYF
jgi:hypothetical protein